MANAFLSLTSRESSELLVETNSLISSFDDDNKGNSAGENCRHITTFLWGISHELIKPLTCFVDRDDSEIEIWSTNRHDNCIIKIQQDITSNLVPDSSFLDQLALNVKNQTKVMESIQQDRSDSNKSRRAN